MNQTICDAIHNMEIISLHYDGNSRNVEPHAYGVTSKGNEVLRCYQIVGKHNSETPHDWELLSVSKISGLSLTGEHFQNARQGYRRNDKAMSTIYAQL